MTIEDRGLNNRRTYKDCMITLSESKKTCEFVKCKFYDCYISIMPSEKAITFEKCKFINCVFISKVNFEAGYSVSFYDCNFKDGRFDLTSLDYRNSIEIDSVSVMNGTKLVIFGLWFKVKINAIRTNMSYSMNHVMYNDFVSNEFSIKYFSEVCTRMNLNPVCNNDMMNLIINNGKLELWQLDRIAKGKGKIEWLIKPING